MQPGWALSLREDQPALSEEVVVSGGVHADSAEDGPGGVVCGIDDRDDGFRSVGACPAQASRGGFGGITLAPSRRARNGSRVPTWWCWEGIGARSRRSPRWWCELHGPFADSVAAVMVDEFGDTLLDSSGVAYSAGDETHRSLILVDRVERAAIGCDHGPDAQSWGEQRQAADSLICREGSATIGVHG